MRLFLYYAIHSFKNQVKKLFRTWVAILIGVIIVISLLSGLFFSLIDRMEEGGEEPDPAPDISAETDPPEPEIEIGPSFPGEVTDRDGNVIFSFTPLAKLDLIITAVILFLTVFLILFMDKSSFFLPADAALLFTSPLSPQSIVAFRLSCETAAMLFAGLYFVFQLPNLIVNMGIGIPTAIIIFLAYILFLIVIDLIKVALYLYSAADQKKRSRVKYLAFGILLAVVAGALVYRNAKGIDSIPAAGAAFLASEYTRYVPMIGWCKGIVMYAAEGNYIASALCAAVTIAGCGLILFVISKINTDFYEEAMAKSEEVAALQRAQKEKGGLFGSTAKRKTDRTEKLRRDGLKHGSGASIYFFKELYNRFRFAYLGFITKTMITYLIVGVGLAAILRLVADVREYAPVALVLGGLAFYRTLGNPLEKDTSLHYFTTVPAGIRAKLLWSIFAGTVNTALDLVIPMAVAAVIMGTGPLKVAAWLLFILSVDLYSTVAGTFINRSLPANAGATLKQIIQIMFLYFGIGPDAVIIVLVALIAGMGPAVAAAALFNIAVAGGLFAFLPLLF